jgi:hypothetical protein
VVDAFIRSFLGDWGSALLDFYQEYSFWINAAILLYALLVMFSRRTYRVIVNSLVTQIKNLYGNRLSGKDPGQVAVMLKKINIPYAEVLKATAFPFITSPLSILPHLKSEKTLQKMISPEVLASYLVAPQSRK